MVDDEPITFHYAEKFNIAGRGFVYCGPCPFDDLTDRRINVVGRVLLVDGEYKEILGMETFAKRTGPALGESVGILFKAKPSWVE